jgi:hypothetical protein
MITNIIVIVSLVLAAAFVVAWCCSPALRRCVERPKYRFLDNVRQYDRTRAGSAGERKTVR